MSKDRPGAAMVRGGGRQAYSLFSRREGADRDVSFVFQVNRSDSPCEEHSHDIEQWMFIHRGTVLFVIDGEEQLARPGDLVYIPRNAVHRHDTVGEEPASVLVIDHWPSDSDNNLGWD